MTRLSSFRRHLLILAVALPAAVSCRTAETVTCSDGTTSKAGKDACSNHGGVQTAAAPTSPKTETVPTASKAESVPAASKPTSVPKSPEAQNPAAAPASGPTPEAALLGGQPTPPAPPTPAPPTGATAECKDGTYSMSKPSSATCSKHGGVKKLLKQ